MKNLMLIDASHQEETRVVITEDGWIQEYDFSLSTRKQIKGNIYLAKVTRVEPSLQAAFVEYGGNRQAFLPFSEIHPDYYQIPTADREKLLIEEEKFFEEQENRYNSKASSRKTRRGPNVEKSEESSEEANSEESQSEAEQTFTQEEGEDKIEFAQPISESLEENTGAFENQPDHEEELSSSSEVFHSDNNEELTEGEETPELPAEYEQVGGSAEEELGAPLRKFRAQRRYRIQEVIKKGQVILIQVIKEERGNKGAAVSTYISLPGRYCVLMPNTMRSAGISRRISDPGDRKRLKSVTESLEIPKGMSVIVRTAGIDRSKPEIKRDFEYLLKLWSNIRENTLSSFAPSLVYEEADIIKRAIRDYYNPNIDEILVESEEGYKSAKELMKMLMPSHAAKVKQYTESIPLFQYHNVEAQLSSIHEPTVKLRSGGYIVINTTEALIAIDVNSGRSTSDRHIEETATRTNLEAAQEISRQIRLRDLAGLIVIDFIDMMEVRNRKVVEKALKESLKSDRAKIQIGRISIFGLLEMTRQRLRVSMVESIMTQCPTCSGTGLTKNTDFLSLDILRKIEGAIAEMGIESIKVTTNIQCALFLLNTKREKLASLEKQSGIKIFIEVSDEPVKDGYLMETTMQPGFKPDKNRARRRPEPSVVPAYVPTRFGDLELSEETEEEGGEISTEKPAGEREDRSPRNKQRQRRIKMRNNRRERINKEGVVEEVQNLNEGEEAAVSENSISVEGLTENAEVKTTERPEFKRRQNRPHHRREPIVEGNTPQPTEITITPAEPRQPQPSRPKIEKISEFKNREPKPREEILESHDGGDDDSSKPKRTGWWSKLIKT